MLYDQGIFVCWNCCRISWSPTRFPVAGGLGSLNLFFILKSCHMCCIRIHVMSMCWEWCAYKWCWSLMTFDDHWKTLITILYVYIYIHIYIYIHKFNIYIYIYIICVCNTLLYIHVCMYKHKTDRRLCVHRWNARAPEKDQKWLPADGWFVLRLLKPGSLMNFRYQTWYNKVLADVTSFKHVQTSYKAIKFLPSSPIPGRYRSFLSIF